MANGIPSYIDHYQVLKTLGSGGFGTVYLARDEKLRREVVLKVLHSHWASDQQARSRFMREARAMARLKHPNIVTVYAVEDGTPQPYIAMEYVAGSSLEGYLRQKGAEELERAGQLESAGQLATARQLSVEEALPILRQMAAALDAAHQQKMVHRDVKPGNVLMEPNGHVKLTDFGIVKLLQTADTSLMTQGVMGTGLYMSPEQADESRQDEIGPASDIYALGVVAYRMLAGRTPFTGAYFHAILYAHLNTPPPDPRTFNPNIPASVVPVLQKTLAKEPANRYRSANAFVNALEQAIQATQPLQPQLTPRPVPVASPRQPFSWPIIIGGVLVLLLIGIMIGGTLNGLTSRGEPTQAKSAEIAVSLELTNTVTEGAILTVTQRSPTPIPSSVQVVDTRVAEEDGMMQVYVPEGDFLMGSVQGDSNAKNDEIPQRLVYLDAYWIDQVEVTNGMYAACVAAGECAPPSSNRSSSRARYFNNPEYSNYPVIQVSWDDADRYCQWAGRRLPTEAEWEKAARGRDGRIYPWGNQPVTGDEVNFCDKNCPFSEVDSVNDGYADTSPVGNYPAGASPYGALDMAGNVWEWVADWYDETYYSQSPERNPTGPSSGSERILRGGSWDNYRSRWLRTVARGKLDGSDRTDTQGFRCAASP